MSNFHFPSGRHFSADPLCAKNTDIPSAHPFRSGLSKGLKTMARAGLAAAFLTTGAQMASAHSCGTYDLMADLPAPVNDMLDETLAREPYAEGIYWQASKGERTLSIIGTIHIGDPRLTYWMPTLTDALTASDALLVEATLDDMEMLQSAMARDPSIGFITEGPTLIDRMPPEDWAKLKKMAQDAGIPGFLAAKMKPWFLAMSMSFPLCVRDGLGPGEMPEGLDWRLMTSAKNMDLETLALEDPLALVQAMDVGTIEEQLAELQATLHLLRGGPDQISTVLAAYFRQNVQRYMRYHEHVFLNSDSTLSRAERQEMMDRAFDILLKKRNRAWIDVIEAQPGSNLMIAVGALHLPGKDGVLELLAARGYELTRLSLPDIDPQISD